MARTSSDTHTALLLNKITNYLAVAFVIVLLVVFVSVYTIRYSIRRDCNDPYRRDIKLFGYWLHVESGSTKDGCVQP